MNFHFYIDSNELCRHCKYEWTHLDNIMVDTPSKSRNLCNFCNYLGIHDTHRLCQGSNLSDKFNISYCLSKSHILRLNYREHRQLSHNNKRLYILSRHHQGRFYNSAENKIYKNFSRECQLGHCRHILYQRMQQRTYQLKVGLVSLDRCKMCKWLEDLSTICKSHHKYKHPWLWSKCQQAKLPLRQQRK